MTNDIFPQPICEQIWNQKYRFKTDRVNFDEDTSVEDTWKRIASSCAKLPRLDNDQDQRIALEGRFYEALEGFKFLPAGRIQAGAGTGRNVTLFNCISADTKILTLEYGLIPIGQIANELVHVLDGNGEWVEAPINSFGDQPTASVNLMGGYNRRQRESINTTKGHRWILSDGSETTTENLKVGDVLKTVYRKNVDMSEEYNSGVQHGIVYGDGSKDYGPKFRIRLCGDKSELSIYFSTWTKITSPSCNGDSIYFGTNHQNMKTLPVGKSVEYMTGFLRGWFATDGCVDKRDGKPILSCGKDELSWITKFGPICGMEVSYSSKLSNTTNYGQRNKEIFNVSFSKWTMIPKDFLNSKHASNFKSSIMNWEVESLSNYGEPEPVYCPSVSTTESFQLGKGIHTRNCFVMGTIPDSLVGIFDMLKEAALTMQQGGGIGYDFSTLRPKNAPVKGVESFSSGPLTFMDVWDSMCKTIMSAGSRRGAMMATMRCDHPDILKFITAKQDASRLRNFNVSVLITDDFMYAVKKDLPWTLHFNGKTYETINAKALWEKILRSTYDFAEPGVIFVDRINSENNLHFMEKIAATNPCVSFDTEILTDKGYQKIGLLVGEDVNVWNGFEFSRVVPKQTGTNQNMVTVSLSDGSELRCTIAHKFILENGTRIQAGQLLIGTKLEKSEWPIIDGNSKYNIDMYGQGFFSGDGWVKEESGAQYIGLYGKKKNIPHDWNEKSRKTYDIVGDYTGTDTSQTKDYLFFGTNAFMPKLWIPWKCSIEDKRNWLAGLIDYDGCSVQGNIQITSKEYSFLSDVKKLINTMGSNGTLSPMKDCWRLSIPASYACDMGIKTHRVIFETPQRKATRFLKVVSVELSGMEEEVFCFTEDKNHSGIFNGVYTAQCGEQPLPPYGACLLGSINLAKFVVNPFQSSAKIDFVMLEKIVKTATRMLDSVIDVSGFPLEKQKEEALNKRRQGLGVTGLADLLFMIGQRYGSPEAVETVEIVMQKIAVWAYEESILMAKEIGSAPCLETLESRQNLLQSGFMQRMPHHIHQGILVNGLRNALLLSIAPTGTISMYSGNVSSGIEPIFATSFTRKITNDDGTKRIEKVLDYAVDLYFKMGFDEDDDWWQDYMTTAQDLDPIDHILMQAAAQEWIDSSISKTVNCPEDITFDDFKMVYEKAYELGCKGCTTYRPNDVTGSVLIADEPVKTKEEENVLQEPDVQTDMRFMVRPEVMNGSTYKLRWGQDAYYVTFNHVLTDEGWYAPFEIFIITKNPEHMAWISALTRMISAVFQRGGDIRFVVEEMQSVFDPKGGQWVEGKYVPSLVSLIGKTLKDHMDLIGYQSTPEPNPVVDEKDSQKVEEERITMEEVRGIVPDQCPSCKEFSMLKVSGCLTCQSCGHSKCG